jgi:hypothetical protein
MSLKNYLEQILHFNLNIRILEILAYLFFIHISILNFFTEMYLQFFLQDFC